jgi:hypothetical protein
LTRKANFFGVILDEFRFRHLWWQVETIHWDVRECLKLILTLAASFEEGLECVLLPFASQALQVVGHINPSPFNVSWGRIFPA